MRWNIAGIPFQFNRFFNLFKSLRVGEDEHKIRDNSQAVSQTEVAQGGYSYSGNGSNVTSTALQSGYNSTGYNNINIQFEEYFYSKAQRISKYKLMSLYPAINNTLDIISDEAIIDGTDGSIIKLEIKEEIPSYVNEKIQDLWTYLIDDVFNIGENGWDLFRKWLVEGELYIELIPNEDCTNLIGIKVLPAHTMKPIYKNGEHVGYVQTISKKVKDGHDVEEGDTELNFEIVNEYKLFDKDEIAWITYGTYGEGFLEGALKHYNMLSNLEDALVVARLVRAPQRRIWNIDVGTLPPGKAEEALQGIIQRYRKKIVYDPSTGAMNSAQNIQSLSEDYWFLKRTGAEGSSVSTIGGDDKFLTDLDDINLFRDNLYTALKLPKSWYNPAESRSFDPGKMDQILREEIKFSRMVERHQRIFKYIFVDAFMVLLVMNNVDTMYCDKNLYNYQFTKNNLFRDYKELDIINEKLAVLGTASQQIYNKDSNPNGMFDPEYVLEKFCKMSKDEIDLNKEMLEKRKAADAMNSEATGNQPPEGGIAPDMFAAAGGMGGSTETPEGGGIEGAEAPEVNIGGEGAPEAAAPEAPTQLNQSLEFINSKAILG